MKLQEIRVKPLMCRVCDNEEAEAEGLCYSCYWFRFGVSDYYAKKNADQFAGALLLACLSLFWLALMGYAIWKIW